MNRYSFSPPANHKLMLCNTGVTSGHSARRCTGFKRCGKSSDHLNTARCDWTWHDDSGGGRCPQNLPSVVSWPAYFEGGVSQEIIESLKAKGHTIRTSGFFSGSYRQGDDHSIMANPKTGYLVGAPDPRIEGAAFGYWQLGGGAYSAHCTIYYIRR